MLLFLIGAWVGFSAGVLAVGLLAAAHGLLSGGIACPIRRVGRPAGARAVPHPAGPEDVSARGGLGEVKVSWASTMLPGPWS